MVTFFSLSLSLSAGRISGPLQEGTAEGVSCSEWYAKGRESKSELEPLSESEHVPFQHQACQDWTIKIFTREMISFFFCDSDRETMAWSCGLGANALSLSLCIIAYLSAG